MVDELSCYFDSPAEPNNVHLEVWVPGHLDGAGLREAVADLLAQQPPTRVRRAAGGRWRRGFTWEVPPHADGDPVSVTNWRTEAELDAARARFLAAAPPLDNSPPFRLLRARGPEWDSLILNAHHAAFDGHSCLLLLGRIADLYSGRDTPPALAPESPGLSPRLGPRQGAPRGAAALRPAARITPRGADAHAAGYGFCLLGWPAVPAVPRGRTAGDGERRAGGGAGRDRQAVERGQRGAAPGTVHQDQRAGRRPPAGRPRRAGQPVPAVHGDRGARPAGRRRPDRRRGRPDPPGQGPARAAGGSGAGGAGERCRCPRRPSGAWSGWPCAPWARARPAPRCSRTSATSPARRDSGRSPRCGCGSPPPRTCRAACPSARSPSEGRLALCFRYRRALLDDAAAGEFVTAYAAALTTLAAGKEDR